METEPKIYDQYVASGEARIIYRHLVQLGEGSQRSAEASECAGAQDKFWEMHDKLYHEQSRIYSEGSDEIVTYTSFAQELGLDAGQFQRCMEQRDFQPQVERDYRDAQAQGIISRPVFEINDTRLIGAQAFERFQEVIEAKRQ